MRDIVVSLIAAFLGFLIAQAFQRARRTATQRVRRWFWEYDAFRKITIVIGHQDAAPGSGEIEASMNVVDAVTLGELRTFLTQHFETVVVCHGEGGVDWAAPIVSLGGPLANSLTARLGAGNRLPVWFQGLPYHRASTRILAGEGATFRSEFDQDGLLVRDVGFVAKLSSEKAPSVPLFVVASNYGAGNHGVATLISADKGLKQLKSATGRTRFQAVVQSTVSNNLSVDSRVLVTFPAN